MRKKTSITRLECFFFIVRSIYISCVLLAYTQINERKELAFFDSFNEIWRMNFVYLSMFAVEFVHAYEFVEDIRRNHGLIDDIYHE